MTSQMKYPISCFSVEVPPETIDVNVDPSKEQVFFHNEVPILITIWKMPG